MTAPLDPPAVRWLTGILASVRDGLPIVDLDDTDRAKAAALLHTIDNGLSDSAGELFILGSADVRNLRGLAHFRLDIASDTDPVARQSWRRIFTALGGDHA